jgi:signal transduction histidine kinase
LSLWSAEGIGALCAIVAAAAGLTSLLWLRGLRRQEADARSLYTRLFALEKRVEKLLADREQSEDIMAAMSDGVLVLDDVGRIIQANASASRLLGAPVDMLQGERLITAVRTFPGLDLIGEALADRTSFERRLDMPGARHFLVQVVPLAAPGGADRRVLLLIRDETEPRRTDAMRRDFVANVSHELKTPLTGLSLLASTLQSAVVDDPEAAREFAGRLFDEIAHLDELVNDLLILSQFEEPNKKAPYAEVDLAAVVRAMAAEAAGKAAERGRALTVRADTPVLVKGDRIGLETLVRNLMGNALRFSDPGGHVVLTVTAEAGGAAAAPAGQAVLTVRDDGIGIPRHEQSRIFERFYRVDKARSRDTGGTGLGLSIVRHIVEDHGGAIELESTLGLGSTFTVRLPLAGGATQR